MSRAAVPSRDLFAEHYVDHRADGAKEIITSRLRRHGLVTLDGLDSRAAVLKLTAKYLDIVSHRDSDSDGLTVIHNTRRHHDRPGFAGLGAGALAPHTERSGTPSPPRLMLFVCARPAEEGGDTFLTDGLDVYTDLAAERPEAVEALSEDLAGFFGGQDGVFAPVFRSTGDGRVSVRLRLDDLVRWNPLVNPHIPALTVAIHRRRQRLLLEAGDAYLIDNSRWLHARTAFAGPRRMYRALGNPRFSLPAGFALPDRQTRPALETA
ncbi:TauD/TfdA family dioxygenase [Actinacidiphila acididurans]|uniref:TauD/TfdA family dioxygenase n=1 Tax=Actinacidiphila acididurans TaxID=2784346 RepID=A0ABS2TXI6_9ACTN|nr:TauD/TfdA family dioxygenase [Actinacidiphila acididurans]MBM9508056.1 TauD/TfdA family dioxygenase [Actinacidiphila acididurans]